MEMRLVKEALRIEQPVGTTRATATVTGEVTLPGGLREETHVLSAQALASVDGADAAAGRINVRGRVAFRVLYTQGDPEKVQSLEATADFMQPCELAGVQSRAAVQAWAQTERVQARASGGRLSLSAEVEITARASSLAPVEAVMAIEGADQVQVLTCEQGICRMVAAGSREVLLREELPLPDGLQIRDTLSATACPVLEAVTGGVGRAGLSGQVLLEAVHASTLPGRPLTVTRHSFPFAQSVEMAGEDGETLDGAVTVKDVAVALQEDEAGRQSLRAEVLLGLEAHSDVQETLSVMQDAYTTGGEDVQMTHQTLQCRTGGGRVSAAESARVTLQLPQSAPPVRTLLAAFAHPALSQVECSAGRANLSGTLDTTLLYMTDGSSAPVSFRLSEPFRVSFAAEITPEDVITLEATEAEAVPITSDRIELRCVMRMQAMTQRSIPLTLISEGQNVPGREITEDIVLCYVQPDESLWDIARRYRIPQEQLRALNPEMGVQVQPGQGILVWRRSTGAAG